MLRNRTAIVTGAASQRGIGKAMARHFAEQGCRVAILDLDARAAGEAAQSIGPDHIGLACDVRDPVLCRNAVEKVAVEFGHIDILINNAGVSQPDRLMEITQENFNLVMDSSLRGSLNMAQAVVPSMIAQKRGSIVSVGSVAAQIGGGIFGGPHYSAAKGGIHSLTKSMARELALHNIRVNAIAPGTIDTDIFGDRLDQQKRDEIVANIPLGRLGTADDIAKAALFLVSDLSDYITGLILDVNGGRFMH
ncbi:SDR family NAD(P)-dependent oxidoreductase [Phyllobacterium sp. SB3]|uniref:SDR family NAD(P)-dependent oxidoreductase n=1 Tax=Phyllobacterium sp. SB3 TaxID=3156073 RepID=UPI0032AEC48A